VASYLIEQHGFQLLKLDRSSETPAVEKSASDAHVSSQSLRNTAEQRFSDVDALLGHATKNWRSHYVTTSIWSQDILDTLTQRPFFILLSIDAPISTRWERFCDRCTKAGEKPPTLEQFVVRNDEHMYDPNFGLAALPSQARIRVLNSTTSLKKLWAALDSLNLTDDARIRPTWDQYFMTLANLAARRSNCMRRQVGCVLVREKRVISTGYNGTPRNITNCNEGGCPRCNGASAGGSGLSTCFCVHAEENALLEAGRERVGAEAVLYCTTCPCLTCCIKIVQVGIKEVVFSRSYYMDSETAALFKEAGVQLRQFSPPKEGLFSLSDDSNCSIDPSP